MPWILIAVLTAVFYGVYNFFIKVSSGHINQILGAVILQIVAFALGGAVLLVLRIANIPLQVSGKGIIYAILAGIFVGLAEITTFYLFSRGITASIGIPVIIGGSIVVGSLLGILFLKETLSPIHYLAIVLIVIGVVLLTTK